MDDIILIKLIYIYMNVTYVTIYVLTQKLKYTGLCKIYYLKTNVEILDILYFSLVYYCNCFIYFLNYGTLFYQSKVL